MTEQTGDQIGEGRVHHSMPFDRLKLQQIVAEVDAEMAKPVASAPAYESNLPIFEDEFMCPAPSGASASVAVPFEEVMPVAVKAPELSQKPPVKDGSWLLEHIVICASALAGLLAGIRLGFRSQDFIFGDNPGYTMIIARAAHFPVVGSLFGLFFGVICLSGLTEFLSSIFPLQSVAIARAIQNTVLGFVAAVKGTAYGIGYAIYGISLGIYYAVTNQLMPSACLQNWGKFGPSSCGCGCDLCTNGPRAMVVALPHIGGVAASIVAVCNGWGTPLTDKLIFGWWGFYALNVFSMIGTRVREKRTKTS